MPPRIPASSEGGTLAHHDRRRGAPDTPPRTRKRRRIQGRNSGFCGTLAGDVVESTNLAPGLLLAMPQLSDPNFKRAVVLMIEHSTNGSFGLVINHPSPITAHELLDSLHMSWRGEDSAVVWA